MLTGVVFGLVPALQAAKVDLNESLKQSSGRGVAGSGTRLRSSIIVFEVALSLVLLVGAGLLIQTLFKLFNQYSVLHPEQVLTMRTELPRGKYKEEQKCSLFYEQVLERVKNIPGVVSAGYTTSVPLAWKGGTSGFYPEGAREAIPGMSYDSNHRQVSGDYLKAMNIQVQRGRTFNEHDNRQSISVAIINETMARQYCPVRKLSAAFQVGAGEDVPWVTIVGVAATATDGLDAPIKEMYRHSRSRSVWFALRFSNELPVIRGIVNPCEKQCAVG